MFALGVQLACLASTPRGTCEKVAPRFHHCWQCRLLAFLLGNAAHPSSISEGACQANAVALIHPGSTSTPAAQLADHSELVRAAAGALAAKRAAADPQALAVAAVALAHVGALAILTLSALPGCSSLPAQTWKGALH